VLKWFEIYTHFDVFDIAVDMPCDKLEQTGQHQPLCTGTSVPLTTGCVYSIVLIVFFQNVCLI